MEGVIGIQPEIKKVKWNEPRSIAVYLVDGRVIIVPIQLLPSLKKTPTADRAKSQIINGNMFTFKNCPEVFHIEQILGKEKDYKYIG
ncbi:MAG: hypothetical protein RL708_2577 [Bacteroidota bacterium]|jgi:hypothetical protein